MMMGLQRPDTLTGAIAKYMRDAIVRGEYAPGARLPEHALAKELNTSRGTVREALRTLADGGLIEIIPRRGMFVSQLSVRATWEITSLRALMEPWAARLALEVSGTDPAIQADVRAAFDALKEAIATGDALAVADADVGFHKALFARCGHQMLLAQLETLQVLSRRLVLINQLYESNAPALIGQHAPMLAAVEARDPARLEEAIRAHVIEAGELLLGQMAALNVGKTRREPKSHGTPFGRWPGGTKPNRPAADAQPGRRPTPSPADGSATDGRPARPPTPRGPRRADRNDPVG